MRFLPCVIAACAAACAPPPAGPLSPDDDPDLYRVDSSRTYEIKVSEPRWVVPSASLPAAVTPMAANNNVDIVFFAGRLHMAWCPYGVRAVNALKEVLPHFRGRLRLDIHYIATRTASGFSALHGQPEVDENIRQLCVKKHYHRRQR